MTNDYLNWYPTDKLGADMGLMNPGFTNGHASKISDTGASHSASFVNASLKIASLGDPATIPREKAVQ